MKNDKILILSEVGFFLGAMPEERKNGVHTCFSKVGRFPVLSTRQLKLTTLKAGEGTFR